MRFINKFKSISAVANALLFGKDTPLSVTISVVGKCNYRCAYCQIWQQKKERMTTVQILRLIDELAALGTQRIGITQDEPLLHEDIGTIVNYCKNKKLFVTLGTNGSLIENKIDEVKNVDVLILSLDGPRNVHDKNRMPGAYDEAIKAIEIARRHGITVWTTTVLTKHNLQCIDFILDKADEFKFKSAFHLLYHSPQIAGNTACLLPSAEDYKKILKKLISEKTHGKPIINSYSLLNYLYDWNDYSNPFNETGDIIRRNLKCRSGQLFLHIESNGDVYPCTQLIGRPLNYLEVGLKKAVENVKENRCRLCCLGGDYIEYNLLCALNPEALWNVLSTLRPIP